MEQDANLKRQVEDNGVIINELDATEQSFNLPASLKPVEKNKNPFTANDNKIELINPGIEPETEEM